MRGEEVNGWRETIVKREKPNSAWDGRGSGDKMILYHRSIDDKRENLSLGIKFIL